MNSVHTQNAEIEFIFMSKPSIPFILFSFIQAKKLHSLCWNEISKSRPNLKLKFQYLRNLKALELYEIKSFFSLFFFAICMRKLLLNTVHLRRLATHFYIFPRVWMKTFFRFIHKPSRNGEREKSGKAEKQKHKMLKGIYFISTFLFFFSPFLCA